MTKTRLQKLIRLLRKDAMRHMASPGYGWYVETHSGGLGQPGGFDFRFLLNSSEDDWDEFEDGNDYNLQKLSDALGELNGTEVIRIHFKHSSMSKGGEFVDGMFLDLAVLPEIETCGFQFRFEEHFKARPSVPAFNAWEAIVRRMRVRLMPVVGNAVVEAR